MVCLVNFLSCMLYVRKVKYMSGRCQKIYSCYSYCKNMSKQILFEAFQLVLNKVTKVKKNHFPAKRC
ncbi:MAG: hypothetical protein JWP78_1678 [Mucilaginibacter sp.]|nr:hypothetical protein [Mucilaginibacter sp.]